MAPRPVAVQDAGAVAAADYSKCPDKVDATDVLSRNAKAFGDQSSIAAALPLTLTYAVAEAGKTGSESVTMDLARWRSTTRVAGIVDSYGVDERGPWTVRSNIGLLVRPRGEEEAVGVAYKDWMLRRRYLVSSPSSATCAMDTTRPVVTLTWDTKQIGSPSLVFDLASASLVRTSRVGGTGRRHTYDVGEWSAPDARGVRWPSMVAQTHEGSDPSASTLRALAPGLQCVHAEDAPVSSCITPPSPPLSIVWPQGAKVTLPFKLVADFVLIEVLVDGRKVWASPDSGAGITVVDGEMPAAKTFIPALTMTGTTASQSLKFCLGELPRLEVGPIVMTHMPVASVPIPALASLGASRPEIILGYSLFVGAAIRIDYAHQKIEFARAADSLVTDKMIAVPVSDLEGTLIAKASVEGHDAPMEIDTGNSSGFALFKSWTDPNNITDGHKTLDVTLRSDTGTMETKETEVRIKTATLGPIHFDDRVANISDPHGMGIIAGLAGNPVLSRCASVVFDHTHRTLWLEGPCDRPMTPERMTGMRMRRREDPSAKAKGLPWVVEAVEPGGPADAVGVVVGDRLASVDGKPAGGDVEQMHAAFDHPEGHKVTIELLRGAAFEKKKLTLTLMPALK